jgi:hypothetical protein
MVTVMITTSILMQVMTRQGVLNLKYRFTKDVTTRILGA